MKIDRNKMDKIGSDESEIDKIESDINKIDRGYYGDGYYPIEEEGYYFKQALGNFIRDFAYGDAINHLVDCGYTAERIIRDYKYPLSDDEIRMRVKKREDENKRKK